MQHDWCNYRRFAFGFIHAADLTTANEGKVSGVVSPVARQGGLAALSRNPPSGRPRLRSAPEVPLECFRWVTAQTARLTHPTLTHSEMLRFTRPPRMLRNLAESPVNHQ